MFLPSGPLAATDASGALAWKQNYRPYGDQLASLPSGSTNHIGFAGKQFDSGTGLSYMGARYYDPSVGRFLATDPAGFDADNLHSFNRYAYSNNNPYKFVDPDGHSPVDVAFLAYDLGKLSVALYTGVGIGPAAMDVPGASSGSESRASNGLARALVSQAMARRSSAPINCGSFARLHSSRSSARNRRTSNSAPLMTRLGPPMDTWTS